MNNQCTRCLDYEKAIEDVIGSLNLCIDLLNKDTGRPLNNIRVRIMKESLDQYITKLAKIRAYKNAYKNAHFSLCEEGNKDA